MDLRLDDLKIGVPAPVQAGLRLNVAAHFVRAGRVGGAEHMLYNLLDGFTALGADLRVLCSSRADIDPAVAGRLAARLEERGGQGSRFVAEQRACLQSDLAGDAILFPNYYVPPVVPRRLGRVITVLHDMQYRHYPAHFGRKKCAWLLAAHNLAIRKADRVVVISEFVRDDVLRLLGRQFAAKLAVIPNPISWQRFERGASGPPPLAAPYILAVAAQYAHKNLDVLLRAFAQAAGQLDGVQLVLCGQDYNSLRGVPGRRPGLLALARELGIEDRVRLTGYVDDEALGAWYRHAMMFAFPSVFEGFGMPPVEALGFGLPTITTRRTALPEATRGLAVYVDDPFSVDEWASCLTRVARDPSRHRPAAEDVIALRQHYAPASVAAAYLALVA